MSSLATQLDGRRQPSVAHTSETYSVVSDNGTLQGLYKHRLLTELKMAVRRRHSIKGLVHPLVQCNSISNDAEYCAPDNVSDIVQAWN